MAKRGTFMAIAYPEWQLAVADWEKKHRAELVCRELCKVNGLLNRHCAPNSLINAIPGPCLRDRLISKVNSQMST